MNTPMEYGNHRHCNDTNDDDGAAPQRESVLQLNKIILSTKCFPFRGVCAVRNPVQTHVILVAMT